MIEISSIICKIPQMAPRRKQDGIVDGLHDLFMHVPAWMCLPVAALAYLAVKLGLPMLEGNNIFLKALAQNSEIFACMAGLVVLATGFTAALKKWERRQIFNRQTDINSIRDLSWSNFELLIGEAYRRQGYQVTETGGGGADGGIDLILQRNGERVLVQCKQWKVFKVGVKPIRELYGVQMAERAHRAIFVTSGVYTQEAKAFAAGKPLELIDGERLCKMIAPVRNQPPQETVKTNATISPFPTPTTTPTCPVCRSPMVLRTAKRGDNAGSQFWGCSTFATTKCKGIRQVEMNGGDSQNGP